MTTNTPVGQLFALSQLAVTNCLSSVHRGGGGGGTVGYQTPTQSSVMPYRLVFEASHVTFCKLNRLFLLVILD